MMVSPVIAYYVCIWDKVRWCLQLTLPSVALILDILYGRSGHCLPEGIREGIGDHSYTRTY